MNDDTFKALSQWLEIMVFGPIFSSEASHGQHCAHGPKTNLKMSGRVLVFPSIHISKLKLPCKFMFVTCKLIIKVLKIRPIRSIRPIRWNPVNFFWLVIRSGSGPVQAKMIPIRSGSGSVRIFDPVAHCLDLQFSRLYTPPLILIIYKAKPT